MKYDSIILDIDGTIWNTTEIVAEAWNKAMDISGFNAGKCTADILKKEFGKPMDIIAEDLWPDLSKEQQEKMMELCCQCEHEYLEANDKDITYPTVVETIKKLSEKIDIYIVSNCQSGYIELTLKKTGLAPYIKDFECFGNTKFSKGKNIIYICNRNNLKTPVYVGDTEGDMNACREAGVDFIFAAYGFGSPSSYVAKLEKFCELENHL